MTTLTGILKFLCVAMLFAFAAQVFFSQAEHSGLIKSNILCLDSSEESSKSNDESLLTVHCCCSPTAFPQVNDFLLSSQFRSQLTFENRDEVIPDGPFVAIDLPPQLI